MSADRGDLPRTILRLVGGNRFISDDYQEEDDGEDCDDVAEGLVGGLSVGDVDVGGACGHRKGDETVVPLDAGGNRASVVCDSPGGIVAQVEDDVFLRWRVKNEVRGRWSGLGVGGRFGVGIG